MNNKDYIESARKKLKNDLKKLRHEIVDDLIKQYEKYKFEANSLLELIKSYENETISLRDLYNEMKTRKSLDCIEQFAIWEGEQILLEKAERLNKGEDDGFTNGENK